MSKLEQFKKQQALRAKRNGQPLLHTAANPEEVAALLAQETNPQYLASLDYQTSLDLSLRAVPQKEARELLEELKQEFDRSRVDELLAKAQHDVIWAIASPLGLGKVLAVYDKQGGNVTTIHNAQQGIYANPDEEYNRKDYTHTKNSEDERFAGDSKNSVGARFTKNQLDGNAQLTDGYTGQTIMGKESSPDHIVPLHSYHKDGGFMQSKTQRADFGTDTENLVSTQRNINQSMSDEDKLDWADKKSGSRTASNQEHYGIDRDRLEAAVARGQEAADRHTPNTSEKVAFYAVHTTQTGLTEGVKMGAQQAFGLLMVELFSGTLDEIKDFFHHSHQHESPIWDELKERLTRVGTKVAEKWKQLLDSFTSGFISGFISNTVTMLINLFVTTGKRTVRMIREGVFALFKAIKTFLCPPKDMTFSQAAHEALKLLAAGGVVIGGVALEESAEMLILSIPLFAPIAGVLTAVLVGATTALAMTLVCYLLDKLDLFGTIQVEQDKYVLESLDKRIAEQLTRSASIIKELDDYLLDAPSAPVFT